MKASLMFVLTALTSWKPLMFLNRKQTVQPKESSQIPQVLYDDFLLLTPRCSIGKPMKLKLLLEVIVGPPIETILGAKYEIEEDERKHVVDFADLIQHFAQREFSWLTERSHPEERLGTVKRNVEEQLPRICRETVCTPVLCCTFCDFQVRATSKICN